MAAKTKKPTPAATATPDQEKVNVNVVTDKQARKLEAEAKAEKATTRKPRTRKPKATDTTTVKGKTTTKPPADPKPTDPPAKPTAVPGATLKAGSTYWAGRLLARNGLENGCPAELVTALAAAQGKPEVTQHGYDLRAAFHAVRGYLDELGQLDAALQPPAK